MIDRPGPAKERMNEAINMASKQGALTGPTTLRKVSSDYYQ